MLLSVLAVGCSSESLTIYLASSVCAQVPSTGQQISCAGTQTLAMQIEHGARPDGVIFAGQRYLSVLDEGYSTPRKFAANQLVLALRPGLAVTTIEDSVLHPRWLIGSPDVPIGELSRAWLAQQPELLQQQIHQRIVSEELSAGIIRSKLELGSADVGWLYASDAQSAGLAAISDPGLAQHRLTYWASAVDTPQAQEWLDGLSTALPDLLQVGFGAP